jgi:hypothetical protein
MSKPTPGPWGIEESSVGLLLKRSGCVQFTLQIEPPEDCRLIAAAPEMLEALKNLLSAICGGPKVCGHGFECICPGDLAREAIAKAEGAA